MSKAIEEIEIQGKLEPGTEGWWPVWGASVLEVRIGDVVVDSSGAYEVYSFLGSTLTQRGFYTSEGEIWAGFMARIKIIRKGTGMTLGEFVDQPAAARARYERIRSEG